MNFSLRLTEKEFTHQVIQVAELYGWLVYFIPDSRLASCRGYPDLTLLYPGSPPRLLVRELKVGKGRVRPEQHTWLNGLRACGFDAEVWRESDWDEIVETLSKV